MGECSISYSEILLSYLQGFSGVFKNFSVKSLKSSLKTSLKYDILVGNR